MTRRMYFIGGRSKPLLLCLCKGVREEEQSSEGRGSERQRLLRSCVDQPVVPCHVSTRVEEVRSEVINGVARRAQHSAQ